MTLIDLLKMFGGTIAGGCITLFIFYKTAWRNKDKELNDCLDKMRHELADHGLKITIQHQNHENLADRHDTRFKHIENKVNQVDNILSKVQGLEVKFEHWTTKIDSLIESVKESKADNKETIKDIKDMLKSQIH